MIPFSILVGMTIMLMSVILWQLYRSKVDEEVKKILGKRIAELTGLLDNQSRIVGYYALKYGEITQADFNEFVRDNKEKILPDFPPTIP